MQYRTFGNTGLTVSLAGLGGGGASRLGLGQRSTEDQAAKVVLAARDLGVNYFDTAAMYGTEDVLGRALQNCRDEVILSTKIRPRFKDGKLIDGVGLRNGLERSLGKLRTDRVDVFHLHLLRLVDYEYALSELVPELCILRDAGKIRFIAVSETSGADPRHEMLQRAVQDECWDVVMVAFNILNQSARYSVLQTALEKNIAVEVMVAARSHFSRPDDLAKELLRLADSGDLPQGRIDPMRPLAFLDEVGGGASLADVSYRLAAQEPGVHVVLTGTGNVEHLALNIESLERPPLPRAFREKIIETFGDLSIAVQVPGRTPSRY